MWDETIRAGRTGLDHHSPALVKGGRDVNAPAPQVQDAPMMWDITSLGICIMITFLAYSVSSSAQNNESVDNYVHSNCTKHASSQGIKTYANSLCACNVLSYRWGQAISHQIRYYLLKNGNNRQEYSFSLI